MRVNLEWLNDFVDAGTDGEALAEELTMLGLEVDSVEAAAPPVEGVIVAKVLECGPHPNADRLSLCVVDDGTNQHQVVCGAPNVRAGITVVFAPVGARLPNDVKIKQAKLRGVVSHGMLCSARELGLGDEADGILLLGDDAPVGTSIVDQLALDDCILDIDITPNRGDCFSVLGVARELAAHRGLELKRFVLQSNRSVDTTLGDSDGAKAHLIAAPVEPVIDDSFRSTLDAPEACPRFVSRVVRGVEIGHTSPVWLRERLRRAGLRAIHPIVDITNYVMLELGQPLHAYDLAKLDAAIAPRQATPGEQLTLLDGREVTLEPDVLVIADEAGAVGIAGVMGGARTAVSAETTDVLLEAAFFRPAAVAGKARRYGLHTDASLRFERGVDPTGQERAIERATRLLMDISGGKPGPVQVVEAPEQLPELAAVALSHARIETLLGLRLERTEVERVLTDLGIHLEAQPDGWRLTPPPYRFDLRIEQDFIEEIGRLYGYDRIPAATGPGTSHLAVASEHRVDEDHLADLLVGRGYTEVITYGFVGETDDAAINPHAARVSLANPISSDMNVMRTSLWPGLLQVARKNLSRQQARIRIFEIGREFTGTGGDKRVEEVPVIAGLATGTLMPEHWNNQSQHIDFYDIKADVEALLVPTGRHDLFRFEAAKHPALAPGRTARILLDDAPVGWLGVLHPELQETLELRYAPVVFSLRLAALQHAVVPSYLRYSKYPSVRRDLAVVVSREVSADDLLEVARNAADDLLQRIFVFDVYTGDGVEAGRKSLALGLILQGVSRTLSDADADQTVQSVTRALEREFGAAIRNQ